MTDDFATYDQTKREEYHVRGSKVVSTIKNLVHEGNVRHIHILHNNNTLIELPMTIVAVGVLLAPVPAALGLLAALATECTLVVERQA